MGKDQDHGIIKVALNTAIGKLTPIDIHWDHLGLILIFTENSVMMLLEATCGQKLREKI